MSESDYDLVTCTGLKKAVKLLGGIILVKHKMLIVANVMYSDN